MTWAEVVDVALETSFFYYIVGLEKINRPICSNAEEVTNWPKSPPLQIFKLRIYTDVQLRKSNVSPQDPVLHLGEERFPAMPYLPRLLLRTQVNIYVDTTQSGV
jgi:hypothetical protein